ncbi:uncharacterized protein B0I36DRAFT_326419 [Microdochium trichocladiopsis]|uniref:Uncharacterized protein n=1 Tax=Microdochium trichocladiopsis TaxID=1682393 RepID=A0A9P9BQ29_9PEZI|nr:uncharacterized protein B0I36DRAFT_326419 [Microdochium trichocladiopsis]KAH7029847.1 hypothetical protein B0I36DRAFT_326419 [Microdochium trichocladiopsis]
MPETRSSSSRAQLSPTPLSVGPRLQLVADDPIESIEQDLDDLSIGSSSDSGQYIQTPSTSTSPSSPRSSNASHEDGSTNSRPAVFGSRTQSDGGLDLGDINAALDVLATTQSGGRARANRRRSSPVDQSPHNVDDEQVPGDRFNNATFQQALREAKGLATDIHRVLGSSDLHLEPSSAMRRLHETASELARFHPPSTRIVGFVGDSGAGKSSLLNSLLDIPGLARTSNEGAACTCVATEYHYHNRQDFLIEIELFTEAQIHDQLADLLKSYRHFHLNRRELHRTEVRDFEERATLAVDTFVAMFGSRLEQNGTSNFLPCLLAPSTREVLRTLKQWAHEAMPSQAQTRIVLSSIAQCSTRLAELTSDASGAQERLPWPFISKIKVFVNAYILEKGLVLVDLPGLRDLNTARRNVTERYLRKVDEIFAVCPIGRATTDEGVMAVFDLAARAGLTSVSIICTRSDDIRPEEAVVSWTGSTRTRVQDAMDDVQNARDAIAEVQLEIDELEMDEEDGYTSEERDLFCELHRQKKRAETQLRNAQFRLRKLVIDTRNSTVTNRLLRVYQAKVPDDTLRVFCVSNSEYWDNRQKRRQVAVPHLMLSGILSIRQHCRARVSESQHRMCTKYMRDSIPALLGEVRLWVSSAEAGSMDAERRRVMRQGLTSLENRLRRDLEHGESRTLGSSLVLDMRQGFLDPGRLRIASWSQGATDACYEWNGWHHASYSAFCRNYGDYCTPKVGSHCWNDEAMAKMVRQVRPMWQGLQSRLDERVDSLAASITASLDQAANYLHTGLADHADLTIQLETTLRSNQHLLESNIHELKDDFDNALRQLQIDATSGIRTSLIGKYMEPAYRNAIHEFGTGSDARRKSYITTAFRKQELFEKLLASVRDSFKEIAEDLQEQVNSNIQEHLGAVRAVLDILRSDNAAREGDENPVFRQALAHRVSTASEEMTRIMSLIEQSDQVLVNA